MKRTLICYKLKRRIIIYLASKQYTAGMTWNE